MQQEKVDELKKPFPIVVSMGGLCASGGYYISMVASPKDQKVIFAEESTMTGSIGVMMPHYDFTGYLEKHNIKDDTLVTHPYKNAGSFTKSFSTEERKLFQELIDDSFVEFKQKILDGRPNLKAEELDKLATGQIFTAKKAKEVGLIDDIGFVGHAIKQAANLANFKNVSEVRPIYYEKPSSLMSAIGLESKSNLEGKMLSALKSAATPRAYYLFTSFPLLEGLSE
jgi:protease-4